MLAQGGDLGPGVASPCQAQPHILHQYIRRHGQQHPERVRQEVRATGPADLHAVVQLLYSPWVYARQQQLEADLERAWATDSIVQTEAITRRLRDKNELVN
jgi:hypothetical protein